MAGIIKENQSGRPAAIDELRRLFGTEHSIHNIYACEDSKRIALLYYKALERNVALSLTDIIGTVDQFDGSQAEKTMLLLHAYLKAGQPIRNIVDTALDPYVEDLDELPCSNSQIDPLNLTRSPPPSSKPFSHSRRRRSTTARRTISTSLQFLKKLPLQASATI